MVDSATDNEISLNLDETNELLFKVSIVGTQAISDKPRARLVCENTNEDFSFLFEGVMVDNDNVKFTIPVLEKKIKPGKYNTKLEIIIGNKLLSPLSMTTHFIEPTKVVIEAIEVKNKEHVSSNSSTDKKTVQATATLVSVKKPQPKQQHKPIEQKSMKEVLKKILKDKD